MLSTMLSAASGEIAAIALQGSAASLLQEHVLVEGACLDLVSRDRRLARRPRPALLGGLPEHIDQAPEISQRLQRPLRLGEAVLRVTICSSASPHATSVDPAAGADAREHAPLEVPLAARPRRQEAQEPDLEQLGEGVSDPPVALGRVEGARERLQELAERRLPARQLADQPGDERAAQIELNHRSRGVGHDGLSLLGRPEGRPDEAVSAGRRLPARAVEGHAQTARERGDLQEARVILIEEVALEAQERARSKGRADELEGPSRGRRHHAEARPRQGGEGRGLEGSAARIAQQAGLEPGLPLVAHAAIEAREPSISAGLARVTPRIKPRWVESARTASRSLDAASS